MKLQYNEFVLFFFLYLFLFMYIAIVTSLKSLDIFFLPPRAFRTRCIVEIFFIYIYMYILHECKKIYGWICIIEAVVVCNVIYYVVIFKPVRITKGVSYV